MSDTNFVIMPNPAVVSEEDLALLHEIGRRFCEIVADEREDGELIRLRQAFKSRFRGSQGRGRRGRK